MKVYPHRQDGADAMGRLIDASMPFDAVLCFSDTVAVGALHELYRRGLRVPDDVAVVSFDDVDEGRFSCPPLTTVAPDKTGLARTALRRLVQRVDGFQGPAEDLPVSYRLALRESSMAGPRPVSAGRTPPPSVPGR